MERAYENQNAPEEQVKPPCQHKWKEAGFIGPYWAYECELCGEEDYRR